MTSAPGTTARTLPLLNTDPATGAANDAQGGGCGCGGCGCGTTTTGTRNETTSQTTSVNTGESAASTAKENDVTTSTYEQSYSQSFAVTGMTCGHCVASVTEELEELAGVQEVSVDLVAGGTSTVTVTSDQPLTDDAVKAAVAEAGYQLS